MKKKGERIEYLDALKGICILQVVFCHYVLLSANTVIGNYFMALAWSAVPCFMLVSGALMHQSSSFEWKGYFLKIGKIYACLCVWRLIYLIVFCNLKELHFGKIQLIRYVLFLTDIEEVNTGVMWYMIAYLVVLLLFPVTYFLFHGKIEGCVSGQKILAFVGIVAAMGGIIIPSANWCVKQFCDLAKISQMSFEGLTRILPFTNYANMIFYFIVGAFLFRYSDFIEVKLYRFRMWLPPIVLISAFGLLMVKYTDTKSFSWEGIYITGGYNHLLTAVMSIGMFLCFMGYRKEMQNINHFLAVCIGRYTLGIYYIHYLILAVCSVLLYPKLINYYSFALNCIKTLLVTALCVILTILVRKIPIIRNLVK